MTASATASAPHSPPPLDTPAKKRFDHRRSTFDLYPQYLFPSLRNNLTIDLEAPYAYSHHQAAFYWTRGDALSAIIWNFPTHPPCLNCVLAGEAVAKRCDRLARQRKSRGLERCCKLCAKNGLTDGCVEMIEVRTLPKFRPVFVDGRIFRRRFNKNGVDVFIWTEEEKSLRREGKVIWRPINLGYGDVETKMKLLGEFEGGGAGEITALRVSPGPSNRKQSSEDRSLWLECQVMMRRKVAMWDREELSLDLNSDSTAASPQESMSQRDGSYDSKEILQLEQEEKLQEDLDGQCEKWRGQLLLARLGVYEKEVKELGRVAANKSDAQWNEVAENVLRGIRDFLEQKASFLERGREPEYACWEAARFLSDEVRDWFERLIPEMLLPV